jgi:hypothetical protein
VSVDAFGKRFGFDHWSEPRREAEALFIWRLALAGQELPGHRALRIETVEQPDAPPTLASLWRPEQKDGDEVLLRVDATEAPSVATARVTLLRVLAEYQSPQIERLDGGPGDVAFGPSRYRAVAFARANVVVVVRNAGTEVESVEAPARELDKLLREGPPAERSSVRPVIRHAEADVAGRQARLVIDAEDPLGRHVWFRFAAKSGEFVAQDDGVVFRAEDDGKQTIDVAAVNENLGVAREQVEFTV